MQIFGGINEIKFYALGTNINQSTGSLPTGWSTTPVLTLTQIFTEAFTGDESGGNLELAITHDKLDQEFIDFKNNYSAPADSSTEKYNNGTIAPSYQSGNVITQYLLAVTKTAKNPVENKSYNRYFVCKASVGDYTVEAEKSVRIATKMVGIKNRIAVDISSLSSGGTTTIAVDKMGVSKYE